MTTARTGHREFRIQLPADTHHRLRLLKYMSFDGASYAEIFATLIEEAIERRGGERCLFPERHRHMLDSE